MQRRHFAISVAKLCTKGEVCTCSPQAFFRHVNQQSAHCEHFRPGTGRAGHCDQLGCSTHLVFPCFEETFGQGFSLLGINRFEL